MGVLYLVATPIGNLDDITLRAVDILKRVPLIAAEDTRHTRRLLDHYNIQTLTVSYHEHNKLTRLGRILEALSTGDVALVSDAGTPALNDPGYELVQAALSAGYTVSPVPGPSAPLAALVVSGLPTDTFLYLGYLPRKQGERTRLLTGVIHYPYTLIFLETPHRLLESLEDLRTALGDRKIAVAREFTKLHEEIFRGAISQAQDHFTAQEPRGEFTLVVEGMTTRPEWNDDQVLAALNARLAAGSTPSQSAAEVAAASGRTKRQVYQLIKGKT